MSWDCSELSEAARLINALQPTTAATDGVTDTITEPLRSSGAIPLPPATPPRAPTPAEVPPPRVDPGASSPYRGDRLDALLRGLCSRAGFDGAVVADANGLPLAAVNSPVDAERLAALAAVLGDSLAQADHLLDARGANNLSVDFNYTDKIVLRQFPVDASPFYLAIVCGQETEARDEVEVTIEQIAALLTAAPEAATEQTP